MSEAFSEVFRPKNPKQLIGATQRKVAQTLLDNVANNHIIQEVLFSGPSGVGKTTIARMYINAIVGYDYDLNPFNCADKTGVDYIRDQVIGTMAFAPLDANYRVYFLDEIHKLSSSAQDSLLVAIEPVPSHVLFIASTTEPEKLSETLKSRMTEFRLTSPSSDDFNTLTKWIAAKYPDKTIDDKLKSEVIAMANGNVRMFVRYLQQAFEGTFNADEVEKQPGIELIKLIINSEPQIKKWFAAVDDSQDFVRTAMGMVGYSIAMLRNGNGQPSKAAKAVIKNFGDNPARTIVDKYTFYNRLLATYDDIIKG